jgi:hypothetical protein
MAFGPKRYPQAGDLGARQNNLVTGKHVGVVRVPNLTRAAQATPTEYRCRAPLRSSD